MNFKELGKRWELLDEEISDNDGLEDSKKFSKLMVETYNALKEEYSNETISKDCAIMIAKMWAFGVTYWDDEGNCFYEGTDFEMAYWIVTGFKEKLTTDNPFDLDNDGMLTLEELNDYKIDPTKFAIPDDYDEFMDEIFD